ncbi:MULTISPECIES: YkvA family protein [unclassified Streptomyces]|uniref:YkvA family protein n=1 Tax=unclassified Streptomyces TaxID=2593676 RepID=UPI002E2EB520|nr:YkvA family protein [Streptomyces sp. NBC_01460]WSS31059.1 YkvA family protein [Streptomyces sp. NBC_01185]
MDISVWLVLGALALLLMAGAAAVLLVRVIRARRLLVDAGIPLHNKALVWASVIYTVSPVDLLPDPVYLDDIGFLLLALRSLHSAAQAAGVGRRRSASPTESGGNLSASGSN